MQGSLRVIQSIGAVALVDAMVVLVAAKHGDDGDVINDSVLKYSRRRASDRLLIQGHKLWHDRRSHESRPVVHHSRRQRPRLHSLSAFLSTLTSLCPTSTQRTHIPQCRHPEAEPILRGTYRSTIHHGCICGSYGVCASNNLPRPRFPSAIILSRPSCRRSIQDSDHALSHRPRGRMP